MTVIIVEIASLITAVTVIITALNKVFNKKIEPLYNSIKKIDENHCKDFLVNFLEDKEKGLITDETRIKRAYEVYDHYTNELHKNSYIHDKWEKLMR